VTDIEYILWIEGEDGCGQPVEQWKPAMKYLMAKQAERERNADRLMWVATGLIGGTIIMAGLVLITTI